MPTGTRKIDILHKSINFKQIGLSLKKISTTNRNRLSFLSKCAPPHLEAGVAEQIQSSKHAYIHSKTRRPM